MKPTIRLLYAEDNPQDADLTRAHFAEYAPEFHLQVVGTGAACLEQIRSRPPDLLLLDHHLPDTNSTEMLKTLHSQAADIPVVVVTGVGNEELVLSVMRMGAVNYVPKQGNYLEALPDLLRAVLGERRSNPDRNLSVPIRQILYVEHLPMDIDLTLQCLAETAPHLRVDVVGNCAEALSRLTLPPAYDLVLADLRMPGQSGLDFLRDAKCLLKFRLPPIVIISGAGDEEVAIAALKLGAADYIVKQEGYLKNLFYRIDRAIAFDQLSHLNDQLKAEVDERKRIEENLRSYQIQLEMQQNELKTAKQSLEAIYKQYFDLYELAPAGYCSINGNDLLLRANLVAANMLGIIKSKAVKQFFFSFILREDRDIFHLLKRRTLADKGMQTSELRMIKNDGAPFWVRLDATVQNSGVGSLFLIVLTDITQSKQLEAALRKSEENFHAIADYGVDMELWFAPDGKLLWVNPSVERLTGYSPAEILALPDFFATLIAEEDRSLCTATFQKALLGDRGTSLEIRHVHKNGSKLWLDASWQTIFDKKGSSLGVRVSLRDIGERKQGEANLRLAASVFTHAREGIMITTADGTITDVNDAFSRITSYSRAEVLGKNPRLLSSGLQGKEFYAAMWSDLVEKGHWYGEVWNRRKSGEMYAIMQTISTVPHAEANALRYVSLFSDITLLKEHEQELDHSAHYDALTNLPNRVLLADRLQQGIAQTRRRGQLLALAFLDLDGFKVINDDYGHEVGDHLLVAMATRMKQTLREGDTLARIGGDEFVAQLLDLADIEASVPMLDRLLAAAAEPVQLGDLTLQVTASLGVTFYPQTENIDADQLLRQADQAMYQAKQSGRNRYHFFDAEQDRSVRGRYESLDQIRQALAVGEFVLYYQPKVNMRTGTVIGAEALIRWQHPEKGLLVPALFLPVIEDHPLAVDMGEWVIDTALAQIEFWQAAGLNIPVSVNVSARHLQQTDFVGRLLELLEAHPAVSSSCLKLELLETSALKNLARVSELIETCREIGVTFAMDDFGTGYSSLTYLRQLPVTTIKIDQSFVCGMLDNLDDLSILKGVLSLSAAFHREVIAEGVETIAHGTMLLKLGCDLAQGFGIARPMPAHEFPGWSAAWRPDPAWADLELLPL